MELNYYDTLIAVADDCPALEAVVPAERGARPTVARIQYELLAEQPYVLTQEDVLFESWLRRQDIPSPSDPEVARLRAEFFARPQACLRSSPLPKRYGWGFHFDHGGRVALCPVQSDEYRALLAGERVMVLKALRSRRA